MGIWYQQDLFFAIIVGILCASLMGRLYGKHNPRERINWSFELTFFSFTTVAVAALSFLTLGMMRGENLWWPIVFLGGASLVLFLRVRYRIFFAREDALWWETKKND